LLDETYPRGRNPKIIKGEREELGFKKRLS